MKTYIQSAIVALALIVLPTYGQAAPLFPEFEVESLLEEAMDQIAEEIRSEIPGDVARLQQLLLDSIIDNQDETDVTEQSTDIEE